MKVLYGKVYAPASQVELSSSSKSPKSAPDVIVSTPYGRARAYRAELSTKQQINVHFAWATVRMPVNQVKLERDSPADAPETIHSKSLMTEALESCFVSSALTAESLSTKEMKEVLKLTGKLVEKQMAVIEYVASIVMMCIVFLSSLIID